MKHPVNMHVVKEYKTFNKNTKFYGSTRICRRVSAYVSEKICKSNSFRFSRIKTFSVLLKNKLNESDQNF